MTTYSGSGYTTAPAYTVQDFLANRWDTTPPLGITTQLNATFTSLGGSSFNFQFFLLQQGETNVLPQNIDDFVAALIPYFPGFTLAGQGPQIKATIRDTIKANLSLENSGFDQATIASALNDPSLQPNSATFYNDVYDSAFAKFLKEFQYTGPTENGTLPIVVAGVSKVTPPYFQERFNDFFVKFATVSNPANSSVNFQEIYEGFFGTGNPDFNSFLANYINSVLYAPGGTGTFLPNENIGDWMKKVQESYSIALHGSAAPTTSSVGQSFKKVVIIDQILRLIMKMIGTLQKVAAMQSDRLRVLTLQQSAYTNLLTQVPVFTQGDGSIFGSTTLTSKDEAQKARDQANNYNQTLSETIRSRRTTVQDDAKVLQSNINQSNDSANDQAGTATALLQTLSTLLGAIYR